jgi:hypothetical protein
MLMKKWAHARRQLVYGQLVHCAVDKESPASAKNKDSTRQYKEGSFPGSFHSAILAQRCGQKAREKEKGVIREHNTF